MAKKNIHPKTQVVKYIMGDRNIEIVSAYSKNSTFVLDVGIMNHAAWQDSSKNFVNQTSGSVAAFNQKFGLIFDNILSDDKKSEDK